MCEAVARGTWNPDGVRVVLCLAPPVAASPRPGATNMEPRWGSPRGGPPAPPEGVAALELPLALSVTPLREGGKEFCLFVAAAEENRAAARP